MPFANAAELPRPTGPVILTITGKISHTNDGNKANFDLAMLEALGTTETFTETPWTKELGQFEGPLARTLMAYVGATGTEITVRALNDYVSTVPVTDFLDHDVILATRRDGKIMHVRDMGPFYITYPFTDNPKLLNEVNLSRSVWQLREMTVR